MSAEEVFVAAEENIRVILKRPRMWGGDEAVELQVLMCLEFRELVKPSSTRIFVRSEYQKFLYETFGSSAFPLFAREGMTTDRLTKYLEAFVRKLGVDA